MVDFDSIRKLVDDDSADAIGPKQVTFEVDYPRADGTWPNSNAVAQRMFEGLSDGTVYDMLRGNTIKLLGLDLR